MTQPNYSYEKRQKELAKKKKKEEKKEEKREEKRRQKAKAAYNKLHGIEPKVESDDEAAPTDEA